MTHSSPSNAIFRFASAPTTEARDDALRISGYAAVFNEPAEIGGEFDEVIRPGAFREALGGDVRLLVNHAGLPLARTRSGTLRLSEDARGLRVEAKLSPESSAARDAVDAIKRGDLDAMSFAFTIAEGGSRWTERDGGRPLREITRVAELHDVSIVAFPAYAGTSVGARSQRAPLKITSGRQIEQILRDAGVARRAARSIAAGGFPALAPEPQSTSLAEKIRQRARSF